MIRPLLRMGHPILRQTAQKVEVAEIQSADFQQFLSDMRESMKHHGGIGLAAPQVGESVQVAVIGLEEGKNRYGSTEGLPFTIFINPVLEVLDMATQGFWEGCLSVPGLRGFVERPRKVKVTYLNEVGEEKILIAENFLATVVQHELDHLWGHLYVDRMGDMRLLSFQEEFQQFYGQAPSLDEEDV
jgi:peptide deformylase